MKLKIGLLALGFALLGAGISTAWPDAAPEAECDFGCPEDGRKYRDTLAGAIARADTVIVSEHSSPWDAVDPESHDPLTGHEFVYRTVVLTGAQQQQFRQLIGRLDPKTQTWATACIPAWRHTIRFYEKGALASTMRICFECAQLDWNGLEKESNPESIHQGLRKFISGIGLEPERDWGPLARKALHL